MECPRAAARVGSGGPSQSHATILAKTAGRPTSEKRGIWSALPSSEALSSGAVRAVAVLSHGDRLRTAGAPVEAPRPKQQDLDLSRNCIKLSRENGC